MEEIASRYWSTEVRHLFLRDLPKLAGRQDEQPAMNTLSATRPSVGGGLEGLPGESKSNSGSGNHSNRRG
jgi:hypothetical protein